MKKTLTLCGLLYSFVAVAQFTTNTAINTTVRDTATFEEAVPIVALAGDNTTAISYFNGTASNPYDFSMQSLDPTGNLGFPYGFTISSYPQNSAIFTYDMKGTPQNDIVAAFQDERTGSLNVVAYRMGMNGVFKWGTAGVQLIDSGAINGGIAPNVGVLSNNDAVVAWIADGSPKDWVAFQKISPTGQPAWTSPHRIIDSTFTASQSRPQVIPTNTDDFFIYYVRQTGFFPPITNMYMQRFDASGQPVWANPVHLSSKTINSFNDPSIVPDGNNGAYIAYTTSNPTIPSFNDVYVQHIDFNGNLWSADGTEACTGTNTQRMSPTMRYSPTMPHPVVLMKETDSGQGSAGATIQSFDAVTGAALLGANGVAVTQITASYDEPYDIQELCGNWVILYAEGSFGNNTMYATKVDTNGIAQWTPASIVLSSVASNKLRGQLTPQISVTSGGSTFRQVVAVWEDERNGRGVYAQNIDCDGNLGQIINSVNGLVKQERSAMVFPNPSSSQHQLQVYSESIEHVNMRMVDVSGRTVAFNPDVLLVNGMNELQLGAVFHTTSFATGVYTLQISGKSGVEQVRVSVE